MRSLGGEPNMKKCLTAVLVAALLISAPGPLAMQAVAQVVTAPTRVAPVASALGSAASSPINAPTASGLTAAPALGALSAAALPLPLPASPIPSAAAPAASAASAASAAAPI